VHAGSAFDNRVTFTFDLLTSGLMPRAAPRALMRLRMIVDFGTVLIACVIVFTYHSLSFTFWNLITFSLASIFVSYSLLMYPFL